MQGRLLCTGSIQGGDSGNGVSLLEGDMDGGECEVVSVSKGCLRNCLLFDGLVLLLF